MNIRTKNKLLALGLDTGLITKIAERHLTVSGLAGQSRKSLVSAGFTEDEAELIELKVNRKAIPTSTIENVLLKSGEVCCFCNDGNNTVPYQIHHIEEYHVAQNNSEDNLLLVCPNHHMVIHKNGISHAEQKQQRRIWESIFEIVSEYQAKGLSFPFGSFEAIDYERKGSIVEIFDFSEPRPSVCKELLQDDILKEVKEILDTENRLILIGNSGSGKSTLAKGIAGALNGFVVFNYLGGAGNNDAIQEIFTFLSQAVKPLVLLIDDANTLLHDSHIERVLKAATNEKKVIVVNTNDWMSGNSNLEQHFLNCIFRVSWDQQRSAVKKELVKNAWDILQYLKSKGLNHFNGQPIGHGVSEYRLGLVIDQYSSTIENVWDLIFLLGSGIELMDRMHVDLVRQDRMDLIVLLISVNQIGKFENGTTTDEILDFYKTFPSLNKTSPPEKVWLEERLRLLIKKRILKNERGRYNTIHRLFARNFIDHSYIKVNKETKDVLNRIFDDFKRVKETLILWNWLENTTLLPFIRHKHCSLKLNEWNILVDESISRGIATVAMLTNRMDVICTSRDSPLKSAFIGKHGKLASLINCADTDTIVYVSRCLRHLRRDCSEVVLLVLELINIEHFEKLIKDINPEYIEEIDWLLNALLEVNAIWVETLCNRFSHEDFVAIASRIKKGDIDSLFNVVSFQRRFVANIKRSQFREYATRFAELLSSTGLEEMHYSATFSSPFQELGLFSSDLDLVLNSLDQKRLANDFTTCSPRHWGKLLSLSFLSAYGTSNAIISILDAISIDNLRNNIEKYYFDYHYELRVLIYQLSYASDEKRRQFSDMLEPFIISILKGTEENDVDDVFVAFCTLDMDAGIRVSNITGKSIPKVPELKQRINEDVREKTNEMENEGKDYELMPTRFTVKRKEQIDGE